MSGVVVKAGASLFRTALADGVKLVWTGIKASGKSVISNISQRATTVSRTIGNAFEKTRTLVSRGRSFSSVARPPAAPLRPNPIYTSAPRSLSSRVFGGSKNIKYARAIEKKAITLKYSSYLKHNPIVKARLNAVVKGGGRILMASSMVQDGMGISGAITTTEENYARDRAALTGGLKYKEDKNGDGVIGEDETADTYFTRDVAANYKIERENAAITNQNIQTQSAGIEMQLAFDFLYSVANGDVPGNPIAIEEFKRRIREIIARYPDMQKGMDQEVIDYIFSS